MLLATHAISSCPIIDEMENENDFDLPY